MTKIKSTVLAFIFLPAFLVAGCSVKLPGTGTPPRLFILSPKSSFQEGLPEVDWQLLIDTPITAAGLNSQRIALNRSELELEFYASAGWTDSLPKLVQRLMIESFENSEKIISVGRQAIGLRADFILNTDLREFQAEYRAGDDTAPPVIRVKINAKLVQMPQRRIVASETFEHLVEAKTGDIDGIIKAFDQALGKALKRIVNWTLTVGQDIKQQSEAPAG